MKKLFVLFVLAVTGFQSYAQTGDLFFGAVGGYNAKYENFMYGLNASYHLTNPVEISFTGLMSPKISVEEYTEKSELKIYSTELNLRYYMLLQRTWGMGPFIGGQYMCVNEKFLNGSSSTNTTNAIGFNLGWHMRADITENIKLNGGWRYTSANEEKSHHLFYVGLGYTFNLY